MCLINNGGEGVGASDTNKPWLIKIQIQSSLQYRSYILIQDTRSDELLLHIKLNSMQRNMIY